MQDGAALIGIDWGTTSFRAYRIGADGRVIETKTAPAGILEVEGGAFEAVLERELGSWLAAAPQLPVLASGMITSRQGWVEVPYCTCPAGSAELAAGSSVTSPTPGECFTSCPASRSSVPTACRT